jgi:hypothetical protein
VAGVIYVRAVALVTFMTAVGGSVGGFVHSAMRSVVLFLHMTSVSLCVLLVSTTTVAMLMVVSGVRILFFHTCRVHGATYTLSLHF